VVCGSGWWVGEVVWLVVIETRIRAQRREIRAFEEVAVGVIPQPTGRRLHDVAQPGHTGAVISLGHAVRDQRREGELLLMHGLPLGFGPTTCQPLSLDYYSLEKERTYQGLRASSRPSSRLYGAGLVACCVLSMGEPPEPDGEEAEKFEVNLYREGSTQYLLWVSCDSRKPGKDR